MGDGRCDCLVSTGREVVTMANFSIFSAFLTVLSNTYQYIPLGNMLLKRNLVLVVAGTFLVICL